MGGPYQGAYMEYFERSIPVVLGLQGYPRFGHCLV